MGKYTKEDILKKVKEDDVEFIRLDNCEPDREGT